MTTMAYAEDEGFFSVEDISFLDQKFDGVFSSFLLFGE